MSRRRKIHFVLWILICGTVPGLTAQYRNPVRTHGFGMAACAGRALLPQDFSDVARISWGGCFCYRLYLSRRTDISVDITYQPFHYDRSYVDEEVAARAPQPASVTSFRGGTQHFILAGLRLRHAVPVSASSDMLLSAGGGYCFHMPEDIHADMTVGGFESEISFHTGGMHRPYVDTGFGFEHAIGVRTSLFIEGRAYLVLNKSISLWHPESGRMEKSAGVVFFSSLFIGMAFNF